MATKGLQNMRALSLKIFYTKSGFYLCNENTLSIIMNI